MVVNDGKLCARILFETATGKGGSFDYHSFESDVKSLIGRWSSLKAGEFNVARFSYDLFELQRLHQLQGTVEFTMVIISLLVLEGVIKHRYPDFDFQGFARPYLTGSLIALCAVN